ncbi:GFA family protein [Pseudomonas sp. Ma2-10]
MRLSLTERYRGALQGLDGAADTLGMPINHCHCQTCRKAHAAAFASSPGKLRHFCSVCGSHLMAERLAPPHVIVRVATLDDDPKMTPQAHIWTTHDVPWLAYESIEKFPEWQT